MPPFVSIIIPVRNEEQHISRCLASIASQDYPKDRYEILVLDGNSIDGTFDLVSAFRKIFPETAVWILENPAGTVTAGLNAGISAAKGEVIMRMDAHAFYAPDYISSCIRVMEETGAANAGGHMRALPGKDSITAGAIMLAHYSPFGLGGGKFHNPDHQGFVDTVWLGCYQREVFERIGPFTEPFTRTEDLDLNSRLRAAGHKIYLSPAIKAYYLARGRLAELWRQRWADGQGIIQTMTLNPRAPGLRHFIPLVFVGTLALLGLLAVLRLALWTFFDFATWFGLHYAYKAFLLELGLWALGAVFFTARMMAGHKKMEEILNQARELSGSGSSLPSRLSPWSYLQLPWVFASLHLSYGLGSLWGLITLPGFVRRLKQRALPPGRGEMPRELPLVSIVLPVRDEAPHIEVCLRSALGQDYPRDLLELVVVDGLSTDGTLAIIDNYKLLNSNLRVLSNPARTVPHAMNLGIQKASGEVIIRFDGHAQMPADYVRSCVECLYRSGAQNVGGPARAVAETALGQAIMLSQYSPFGLGGADFRTGNQQGPADTVPFGCFFKRDLIRYGLYDSRLDRNQDIELNARIRKKGGAVILCPEITSFYFCRRTLKGLFKQNFKNGRWAVYTRSLFPYALSVRHFAPLAFVLSLLAFGLWAYIGAQYFHSFLGKGLFLAELLAYFMTMAFFTLTAFFTLPQIESLFVAWRISRMEIYGLRHEQACSMEKLDKSRQHTLAPTVRLMFLLPLAFVTLHLSYGLGSVWGLMTLPGWLNKVKSCKPEGTSPRPSPNALGEGERERSNSE